ncbi:hypothetical protein [Virgibacillus sp. L01]|uniref:hypothetical protein n=1 Tax=Virgibacillus sp. L01 TaxID=3457429 RepID=UPI003FD1367D
MRDLLGYFLISQAIITGVIVYSVQHLSESIKASASYVANVSANNDAQLSWGTGFTPVLYCLLVVVGLGIFLIVKKNND